MKIISGGQTGIDRAALDAAIEMGVEYGGWCPKGGWAEDFRKPPGLLARYPLLRETPSAEPIQRTEWNVRDADRLMILIDVSGIGVSKGTVAARDFALALGKPHSMIDLDAGDALGARLCRQRSQRRIEHRHRRTARKRSAGHLRQGAGIFMCGSCPASTMKWMRMIWFATRGQRRRALLPIGISDGMDECDACLCALLALVYGYGGKIVGLPTMQPPTGAIADIKREGWIFYSASDWRSARP